MATYEPWRCVYCKKISKASARGCSECLVPWQECVDTTFVPGERKDSQQWYQAQQSPRHGKREQSQQPKSPRYGGGQGRGRGQNSGKGKTKKGPPKGPPKGPSKGSPTGPQMGQGKGKGKDTGKSFQPMETMVPPEPPWTPTLHPNQPLPAPVSNVPSAPTEDEKTLKELLQALQKAPTDQMDPEVHAIVQRSRMKEGRNASQSLYSAVDSLSAAREALDVAKLARHNLHIKWRNFLTDAVQRWQKHTEDFQKEEADLTQQIDAARVALVAAATRFEDSKKELGENVVDVEAHAAMEEASDTKDKDPAGEALSNSLVAMRSQLVSLQASAEAMVTDEANSNKRPRLEESFAVGSGPPGGMPSPSAPAMQAFPAREPKPFHQPDKQ